MTRNEFVKLLEENIKPDAEMDFLVFDRMKDDKYLHSFLDIRYICMNADVDDPNNYNRGGVVFKIQTDMSI